MGPWTSRTSMATGRGQIMDRSWTLAGRLAATALAAVLTACTGRADDPTSSPDNPPHVFSDLAFLAVTEFLISPAPNTEITLPGQVSFELKLIYRGGFRWRIDDRSLPDDPVVSHSYSLGKLQLEWADAAGVTRDATRTVDATCEADEVPAYMSDRLAALTRDPALNGEEWRCATRTVTFTAGPDAVPGRYPWHASAEWITGGLLSPGDPTTPDFLLPPTVISRTSEGEIGLHARDEFSLIVKPRTSSHPTGAYNLRDVLILHAPGVIDPVSLEFVDSGGNGLTGIVDPNPAVSVSQIRIAAPSRLAAGGSFPAALRGTLGGRVVETPFEVVIDPLFSLTVPELAVASFSAPALLPVSVSMPYLGPTQLHLTVTGLPPGVAAGFEPDADPGFSGVNPPPEQTRKLRISVADPNLRGSDLIRIRATVGAGSDAPFIERALSLSIAADPPQSWQFFSGRVPDLSNGPQAIGLALRSDDMPVLARLEDRTDGLPDQVHVSRFDGTAWIAEAAGPLGPVGDASFALAAGDRPVVAVIDPSGDHLSAHTLMGATWHASGNLRGVARPKARSPRVACSAGGPCVLAWIEVDDPLTGSELFVRRQANVGEAWTLRDGPQPSRSLNRDANGQVQAGSVAVALSANGDFAVAWLERPNAGPPALPWMRISSGAGWSAPIALPVVNAGAATAARLAMEATGAVVAAWTEGSPKRLMVARWTAAGGWQRLVDGASADGALNVVDGAAASEFSLAIDGYGQVLVAWAEASQNSIGPNLDIRVKRCTFGIWYLLGTKVADSAVGSLATQIATDSAQRPYLAYTRQDYVLPMDVREIHVARWLYP